MDCTTCELSELVERAGQLKREGTERIKARVFGVKLLIENVERAQTTELRERAMARAVDELDDLELDIRSLSPEAKQRESDYGAWAAAELAKLDRGTDQT